jgi:hypothetical protein
MIPLTSSQTEPYTPPALEKRDPKPVFHLSVPTLMDRDVVNTTLANLGLRQTTAQYFRAALINELYTQHDEEKADELAALIEEVTQAASVDQMNMTQWFERERERVLDAKEGVEEKPPEPMPKPLASARKRAQQDMVWEETINASPKLLALRRDNEEYERRMQTLLARIHLSKWTELGTERIHKGGVLTEDCTLALRHEVGEVAWNEILARCYGLYDLQRSQVGNSDSPPENASNPSGSVARSGDGVSNDGASTKSKTPRKPTTRQKNGSSTAPLPTEG